ncbi:hypothetical protein RISK_005033 [Rhodopirellula islandica]|uniref:Uncharacterized protein n=1 Tax=Rhodopirellula islandica TaxID=595434 RepID=A0A0J1B7N0_RHOIS|nr:hypothetical protein RISK_005033 [Rhodopirellula islandica]
MRGTIRCNRAAKSGGLKWLINRRRRLIGNVICELSTEFGVIRCELPLAL